MTLAEDGADVGITFHPILWQDDRGDDKVTSDMQRKLATCKEYFPMDNAMLSHYCCAMRQSQFTHGQEVQGVNYLDNVTP